MGLLVLRRNVDQSLIIDGKIKVMVVEVHRGYAKIGIDAPKKMSIEREELIAPKRVDTETDQQLNDLKIIAMTCRKEINDAIAKGDPGLFTVLCNYLNKEFKLHNL